MCSIQGPVLHAVFPSPLSVSFLLFSLLLQIWFSNYRDTICSCLDGSSSFQPAHLLYVLPSVWKTSCHSSARWLPNLYSFPKALGDIFDPPWTPGSGSSACSETTLPLQFSHCHGTCPLLLWWFACSHTDWALLRPGWACCLRVWAYRRVFGK